jgi:hypothetical protein
MEIQILENVSTIAREQEKLRSHLWLFSVQQNSHQEAIYSIHFYFFQSCGLGSKCP